MDWPPLVIDLFGMPVDRALCALEVARGQREPSDGQPVELVVALSHAELLTAAADYMLAATAWKSGYY